MAAAVADTQPRRIYCFHRRGIKPARRRKPFRKAFNKMSRHLGVPLRPSIFDSTAVAMQQKEDFNVLKTRSKRKGEADDHRLAYYPRPVDTKTY